MTLDGLFEETKVYLESPAAHESLAADPYWPKWDSPWWRLVILLELGRSDVAPRAVVDALSKSIARHYLTTFPFKLDEIPAGKDPQREILCLCALGSADRILRASGVELQEVVPWTSTWYTRYQMADGGWNCDEQAYTRATPRSSVVSSLPMLEALLERGERRTPEQTAALDRGAAYLIARRLVRSISKGCVADESWLRPCFPRFYEYDLLRGLTFVGRWSEQRGLPLPEAAVSEVVAILEKLAPGGELAPGRRVFDGPKTIRLSDGAWVKGPTGLFPLLEEVSRVGEPNLWLTIEWQAARSRLERLRGAGLLVPG